MDYKQQKLLTGVYERQDSYEEHDFIQAGISIFGTLLILQFPVDRLLARVGMRKKTSF